MFPGYRDVEQVGEGGLGVVYRGVRASTGGMVAIKELRSVATGSPAWHRARRELEALLRLKGHPYVVSVEEIVQGPEGPALVMEYLPGGSLDARAERGPLPIDEVLFVTHCVARALDDAHAVGIVHRDVKPHNVLVGSFGQVKVCDFGISSLVRGEGQHSQTRSLTLAYASPEELDGETVVGPPADVYSLSASLVHLLTGRAPTFRNRISQTWSIPYEDDPVYAPFIGCVRQGLATEPADRPTMSDLVQAVDEATARARRPLLARLPDVATRRDSTVPLVPPPTLPDSIDRPDHEPPEPSSPRRRRRLSPARTGVAALVAMVAIGVFLAGREARNGYTVAFAESGAVAVYQGRDLLWFSETEESVSASFRDDLDAASVALVEGRPRFASQAEAERFIAVNLSRVESVDDPTTPVSTTAPMPTGLTTAPPPAASNPGTTPPAPSGPTDADRKVCSATVTMQRSIAGGFGSTIAASAANFRTTYEDVAVLLSASLADPASAVDKVAEEVQAAPGEAESAQPTVDDLVAACVAAGALD